MGFTGNSIEQVPYVPFSDSMASSFLYEFLVLQRPTGFFLHCEIRTSLWFRDDRFVDIPGMVLVVCYWEDNPIHFPYNELASNESFYKNG